MKRIITSIVAASILATSAFAADAKTARVSKNAVIKAEHKAQNTQLIKEAVRAVQYTQDALIYLHNKKDAKAKDSLKKAVGELAIVLNSPKAPYLLPIDVQINAYQFNGKISQIQELINQAKKLLKENQIPQAREILNSLRSEIDIKTINLPLATYPAALNLAIKYVNEHKYKDAEDVLSMALSTLVEVDNIVPIPLIKAQALTVQASKIIKKDKKEAVKYLQEAKRQLILAQKLGYTSTSVTTYKMLKNEIVKLENKIENGHKTADIFSDLIEKLKEFKQKAISVIHK